MTRLTDLHAWIAPVVATLGCELWGIEFKPSGEHSLLRVFIDKADGITLDDCERVSKQVSAVLDVEDPISTHYRLEISSPGMNRTLFTVDQMRRYIGHEVIYRMQKPIAGRRRFEGILEAVTDDAACLLVEGEKVSLPLGDVEKARLI